MLTTCFHTQFGPDMDASGPDMDDNMVQTYIDAAPVVAGFW